MSNRYAERGLIGVINPPEHPYLHVVPSQTVGGKPNSYRYIDSLSGMVLLAGYADLSSGVRNFSPKIRIELPFLPDELKVGEIKPLDGIDVVKQAILEERGAILRAVDPRADVVACIHGSMWGLYPEELISQVLQEGGFNPRNGFPEIERMGRKRIKVHAVVLHLS